MSDHECIGLRDCIDHPKWAVAHRHGLWFAYAPYAVGNAGYFRTWREAFHYAHTRATEEAAISEIVEEL